MSSGKEEKEEGNEVGRNQEDGESRRKPGRKRTRGRRKRGGKRARRGEELVTRKKDGGGEPGEYRQLPPSPRSRENYREKYYVEDGVGYYVVAGLHEITPRELDEYTRNVAESEGYDVETESKGWFAPGGIGQVVIDDEYRELLIDMAKFALVQYNMGQGTHLVLKEVKKANQGFCDGFKYYITFEVEDPDDQNADPVKVFQAQVVQSIGDDGYRVDQIRPKPTTA